MADEDAQENTQARGENDTEAAGGSGKKKIVLLAIVILVLVGVSVGGTIAVMTMLGKQSAPVAEDAEATTEETEAAVAPAIYYAIKPAIIVSFETKGRQRFLQAEITLMTRDDEIIPAIESHMPMLRNALLMLIGGQLFEDLQTAEGKELLRVQCLQELQRLIEQETGTPGIEQVLFTNLVMQ